jgi:enoyl-[acyl-carrier protein] reductase III
MNGPLQGKTALVTGGTRGIGKGIALALARQGARVLTVFARDRKAADALEAQARAEGLSIETIRGDLGNEETFNQVVAAIREKVAAAPKLDIIVHSAASGVHKSASELSARHLSWTFNINLFSIHNLVRELFPLIPDGGRLVGITSSGGVRTLPHYAAVGSSKGALESLFRHYAVEFAPRGIAVNLVSPGMVMTEAVEAFPDKEARIESALRDTPTGKMTTPEQVGAVVCFLCSDAAAQIIGQTIVVDGGRSVPT